MVFRCATTALFCDGDPSRRIVTAFDTATVSGEGCGMTWDIMCRVLGVSGVAFFIATAFTPLAHQLDVWMAIGSHPERADAIVVLANGLSPGGMLTAESALRTERALTLYRQGFAPRLVFLGGEQRDASTEADVRAKLARFAGVPSDAILTESRVRTTREEAIRVQALLQPKAVRTILLITNSGHLRKARPLFESLGFTVYPVASDTFVDPRKPEDRLALMRSLLEELLGGIYYWLAGYI